VFERYTEAGRRLIFLARNEAIQCGSPFIETEHFLLALLQEENSLLRRLLPADTREVIENELRETLHSNPCPKMDIPLSHSLKRVPAYGAEAAEVLRDPHIGSEHHLLGLLKEADCPATRILEKHGITREQVFRKISVQDPAAIDRPRPKPTRETLNALVATLPEGAIEQACRTLEHLLVWPPRPPEIPSRIVELQKEMHERFKRGIRPGTGMVGGSGGGWSTDSQGRLRDGSFSSTRMEDGARVTETHRFFQGHEITIIEGLRIKGENKMLSYSQEIHGPNREHHFEIDFDIG
jgi:hypothetical protein